MLLLSRIALMRVCGTPHSPKPAEMVQSARNSDEERDRLPALRTMLPLGIFLTASSADDQTLDDLGTEIVLAGGCRGRGLACSSRHLGV